MLRDFSVQSYEYYFYNNDKYAKKYVSNNYA